MLVLKIVEYEKHKEDDDNFVTESSDSRCASSTSFNMRMYCIYDESTEQFHIYTGHIRNKNIRKTLLTYTCNTIDDFIHYFNAVFCTYYKLEICLFSLEQNPRNISFEELYENDTTLHEIVGYVYKKKKSEIVSSAQNERLKNYLQVLMTIRPLGIYCENCGCYHREPLDEDSVVSDGNYRQHNESDSEYDNTSSESIDTRSTMTAEF